MQDRTLTFENGKLVDEKVRELSSEEAHERTRAYRAGHYPPVGDQLDAIWKLIEEMGAPNAEAQSMLGQIKSVKRQFPKED